MRRLTLALAFLWKYFLGVLFTQIPPAAFLIVGWTMRFMRRTVFAAWQRQSSQPAHDFGPWPHWVRGNGDGGRAHKLFGSLWENLRLGVQGTLTTWVLTWPGCILWLFAWYAGWNNSFNKGYEQAIVGPLTFVIGSLLFVAAMLYVPTAQARHAVTGEWRAFFHFSTVWAVIKRRPVAALALAGMYSLACLPITLLRAAPSFLSKIFPDMAGWSDAQLLQFADKYYFRSAIYVLAAYVIVRWAAARLYASGILEAVRAGDVRREALAPVELERLESLGLLTHVGEKPTHWFYRSIAWAGRGALRSGAGAAALAVWLTFVAQIFAAEFLNYKPKIGWLNQPLVHVPYFQYIPDRLRRAVKAQR